MTLPRCSPTLVNTSERLSLAEIIEMVWTRLIFPEKTSSYNLVPALWYNPDLARASLAPAAILQCSTETMAAMERDKKPAMFLLETDVISDVPLLPKVLWKDSQYCLGLIVASPDYVHGEKGEPYFAVFVDKCGSDASKWKNHTIKSMRPADFLVVSFCEQRRQHVENATYAARDEVGIRQILDDIIGRCSPAKGFKYSCNAKRRSVAVYILDPLQEPVTVCFPKKDFSGISLPGPGLFDTIDKYLSRRCGEAYTRPVQ